MIEVRGISKRFVEPVFKDFSLSFEKPETLFVLGKSGVGKSVLLKHLVGLVSPDSGSIVVDGEDLATLDQAGLARVRKKCGMVFQFPALLDSLSVFENVSFGIYAHDLAKDDTEVRDRVIKALGYVNLSERILQKYPSELSFGIQKRVAIARTLAIEPEYLFFDEPTTGMDPIATHGINALIRDLKTQLGVGTIVVSHDLESAFAIGDRIVLLEYGKAVFDGTPDAFRRSSVLLAQAFLKEAALC